MWSEKKDDWHTYDWENPWGINQGSGLAVYLIYINPPPSAPDPLSSA